MKRTSALALVIAVSCLLAWPQQGQGLECSICRLGHGSCFVHSYLGRSTTGLTGCLFGHCRGGGGVSRSATNFGYGRISRPRSAFVAAQPAQQAPVPTYPPVPVLGGVGGAITAPPALPVPLYTQPSTTVIPSVPAPAPVTPYVQPMVVVPQVIPSAPYVPCPAPVCAPCTPYNVCPPPCAAPVETCVPCDPYGGSEIVVPGGSCDPCGPMLAPACDYGPY